MKILIKLKNNLFEPINFGTPDENYTFILKDLIDFLQKNYTTEKVDLSLFKQQLADVEEDEKQKKQRLKKADLQYPLIVMKNEDDSLTIVDGTHRARKAIKKGISSLDAFVIKFEDLKYIKEKIK